MDAFEFVKKSDSAQLWHIESKNQNQSGYWS